MLTLCSFIFVLLLFSHVETKSIKKSNAKPSKDDWQGKWFPQAPWEPHIPHTKSIAKNSDESVHDDWSGKWFPQEPSEPHIHQVKSIENGKNTSVSDDWSGKWFPHNPAKPHKNNMKSVATNNKSVESDWPGKWFPQAPWEEHNTKTFKSNKIDNVCDDGMHSLGVDYDPDDKRHNYKYLCLANRRNYTPNLNVEAQLVEHFIPPAYMPPMECLSESINYSSPIPTFGPIRPLPPMYGTYQYLPPQRWLHSLAAGAIVMLYHPCAFSGQVKLLEKTTKGCLYRHIITPSQLLSPERPLALLAWGKCLQMSVVDERLVADFIRKNGRRGPLVELDHNRVVSKFYKTGLLSEAHLVTDEQDMELCGYMEM